MARLRRQIKEEILTGQQMPQGIAATNIGDIDGDPISNVRYIRRVAAILGDHAVDQQNLCAQRDETPRDGRADEAQPAGNYRPGAGISFEPRIRPRCHPAPPSRRADIPRIPPTAIPIVCVFPHPWAEVEDARVSRETEGLDVIRKEGPSAATNDRSEERRVGKECRSRWSP